MSDIIVRGVYDSGQDRFLFVDDGTFFELSEEAYAGLDLTLGPVLKRSALIRLVAAGDGWVVSEDELGMRCQACSLPTSMHPIAWCRYEYEAHHFKGRVVGYGLLDAKSRRKPS